METRTRDRLISGAGAAIVTAGLGAVLIAGLTVGPAEVRDSALAMIDVILPPPPPPPPAPKPPPPVRGTRAAKASGAPAPKARATPVVVPPPIVAVPAPPVVAAPKPGVSSAPASGASTRGSGTGAGGEGDGPGGGGDGGEGDFTPPIQIAGRVKASDLPPGRLAGGARLRVHVDYMIEADGRVTNCRATPSSGDRELDMAVCQAIERRYRFRPARDENGRPIRIGGDENHEWVSEIGPDGG